MRHKPNKVLFASVVENSSKVAIVDFGPKFRLGTYCRNTYDTANLRNSCKIEVRDEIRAITK